MNGYPLVLLAVAAAGGSAVAAAVGRPSAIHRAAGWLLVGAALSLWTAVVFLLIAILGLDTSFTYVAEQTRIGMSGPLRFSALWSGAEGSLLLFASFLASALVVEYRHGPRWQRIGASIIVAGFAAAVAFDANPFQRLDLPPVSGIGMAPILEHWAMVIHPPLLYAGLCLSLTPALVRDRALAHRLAVFSLGVLTAALGFGSAWAYVELGWGGWWAWDPIENVALVVWLLLAAALHWRPLDRGLSPNLPQADSPQVGSPQAGSRAGSGTGLLAATALWTLCWPAVIAGTALTRTSLRTSVHAFADAAGLSVWLWPLATVAGIGVGLRVWEDRPAVAGPLPTRLPQIVLATVAFVVAAGTYRPFVSGEGTEGWFYSRTLFPVAVLGAILIGVVPLLTARDLGRLRGLGLPAVLTRIAVPGMVVFAGAAAMAGWRQWFQLVLAASIGFGLTLVVASGRSGTARLAGHLGVLCILFGALAGTVSTQSSVWLQEGEPQTVDGHTIELVGGQVLEGPEGLGRLDSTVLGADPIRAEVRLLVDDSYELVPSVTVYPERNLRLPEVATRTRPWLDSQAVLREGDEQAGVLVTVLFRPWNQLVWWGACLLCLAAALIVLRPRTGTGADGESSAGGSSSEAGQASDGLGPNAPVPAQTNVVRTGT